MCVCVYIYVCVYTRGSEGGRKQGWTDFIYREAEVKHKRQKQNSSQDTVLPLPGTRDSQFTQSNPANERPVGPARRGRPKARQRALISSSF